VTDEQATVFDPTIGPRREVPEIAVPEMVEALIALEPTIGPKWEVPEMAVPEIVVPEIAPEDVTDAQATAFDPTIGPR
jgi:hypothetical protein